MNSQKAIAIAIALGGGILPSSPVFAQQAPSNDTPAVNSGSSSSPPPEAPVPTPPPPAGATPEVHPSGAESSAGPEKPATAAEHPSAPANVSSPQVEGAKATIPAWLDGVTLGAGVMLWYYQPIDVPQTENSASVFWARLLIDGKWGRFGLHLEPRFRDSKLRPFFDGPAWLQEAYASADLGPAELRVGKTYSRLGLFWYTSFYGNVQVYDGLKLDPDYGITLQGDVGKASDTLSLGWWAQYFLIDGGTNVSLPDRDTISYTGAHRRNQAIARVEPRVKVGPATVALGASAEYLEADLPSIGPQNVYRGAGDLTVTGAGLTLRGEYLHQSGKTVTDFPIAGTPATATTPAIPGQSSGNNDYFLAGVEYAVGPVTAVYTFSEGSYNDVSVKQLMHVPAIAYAVSPNISLLGELVFWSNQAPSGSTLVDRSFNVTLHAHL